MRPYFALLLPVLGFAMAACGPVDDRYQIVGEVISTIPSPDNSAIATLTRENKIYRVYVEGKLAGEKLEKIYQVDPPKPPQLAWEGPYRLMLVLSGGTISYVHSNDTGYLHPDASHKIDMAWSLRR